MQPMKAKEAADQVLAHVYGHVDAFRGRPPRPAKQFAAAGLMRCCALLKGILVLDEARMPALTGILARQHWEDWLVSLYGHVNPYGKCRFEIEGRAPSLRPLRSPGNDA